MTTTPPLPNEPEDARDEAKQALDDLYTKPRQDESGQTAYAAVPPPLPSMPPLPEFGPQPGQAAPGTPADWQSAGQSTGQPAGSQFGQPGTGQYGQPAGQQSGEAAGPQFGQPGDQQFQQASGQPLGQSGAGGFGQPQGGQQFGQPSGQPWTQPTQAPPPTGQTFNGQANYGQYPTAPPAGPYDPGYGYGQSAPGGPGMPGMPPFASWLQRVGAWLLDNFLVGVALELIVSWSSSEALRTATSVIALLWALYNAYLAGSTGQSYGKRAVGIRLARLDNGAPVGGGYGLLRWLMNLVFTLLCFIPGLLNYLWPLWDAKSQTWSDKIAGSVVVRA